MGQNPEEKIIIEKFVKTKEFINNISLIGFIYGEKKYTEYLNSDIFVFSSLDDSFGLVNLEAMSSGLPIIATPQGAIPEYIIDGLNGYNSRKRSCNIM